MSTVAAAPPGPEECADCHPDETEGYLSTGMGRSLYRPSARPAIEDFSAATVKNGAFVYRAYVDAEGRWWQEETVPGTEHRRQVQVTHVVGSGNHTRSYFGEVEGQVVELPLTWYARRKIWDMSPGYEGDGNQRFERLMKPDCLFCHNDLVPSRDDVLAGYTRPLPEGITCTRCHGDGAAHVAARAGGEELKPGEADPTILNPKRLSPKAQLRVCQQCHLQGEQRVLLRGQRWDTYDVRQPLESYMAAFVYADDRGEDFSIASHGQRLALSKCATASPDGLPCTTCHNPHGQAADRAGRAACLSCHQIADCGDAHGAREKPCAGCHMRVGDTSDIPHVSFTDHYIRKRTDAAPPDPPTKLALVDALAADRVGDDPDRAALRVAIAHAQLWRYNDREAHRDEALRRLLAAVDAVPDDPRAWYELGHIFGSIGDLPAAARAFDRLEALQPEGVVYRTDQAQVLENQGDLRGAERTLRRALELSPNSRIALNNLGNVLQRQSRFDEAEAIYAQAEAVAPDMPLTALNRGFNLMQLRRFAEAKRWFLEAKRRDATLSRAPFALGLLATEAGDLAAARAHYDDAIAVSPTDADAWWLRGRLAMQAGDLQGARRDLERLVALAPQRPEGYLDLAEVLKRLGDSVARAALLGRGLESLPGHPALIRAARGGP